MTKPRADRLGNGALCQVETYKCLSTVVTRSALGP